MMEKTLLLQFWLGPENLRSFHEEWYETHREVENRLEELKKNAAFEQANIFEVRSAYRAVRDIDKGTMIAWIDFEPQTT